jgi:hypothetical protein
LIYFDELLKKFFLFLSLKRLFSDFVSRTGSLLQIIIAGRMPEKIGRRSPLGGWFEKIGGTFLEFIWKSCGIQVELGNFRWSSLGSLKTPFSDFVSRTGPLLQKIIAGRMPEKIGRRSPLGGRFEKIVDFQLMFK